MDIRTQQRGPAHPTPITYIKVAFALTAITAVEVSIILVNLPALRMVIIPSLFILSSIKFALVGLFYMHLKFDSRIFSGLFVGGLALATAVILALLWLFKVLGA